MLEADAAKLRRLRQALGDSPEHMISLIHKKKVKEKGGENPSYGLFAIEEILFWGGLGALALGSGWLEMMGGIAIGTSIVMVIYLVTYT